MKISNEKDNSHIHYDLVDIGVEEKLSRIHGERFREYRKKWYECNNNLVASEKPLYLVLETNSYCNLKCKMCEKNFYTRNKKDIEFSVVEKLSEECKEIGLPSILVGAGAESLINPKIKKILRKIKGIGAVDNFLITNGTKLTQDFIRFLIELQFERLYVSIDAATPETYKKIRGTDLSLVENNIDNFLKIRNELGTELPLIRVSFCLQESNKHELDMFIDKWKDKVDIIDVQKEIDFSNLNNLKEIDNVEYKCQAPFTTLEVNCEGDIYPCCTFYNKYLCLGNIKNISLMQAWNSEKMLKLREQIITGNLSKVCKNCAYNLGK